ALAWIGADRPEEELSQPPAEPPDVAVVVRGGGVDVGRCPGRRSGRRGRRGRLLLHRYGSLLPSPGFERHSGSGGDYTRWSQQHGCPRGGRALALGGWVIVWSPNRSHAGGEPVS